MLSRWLVGIAIIVVIASGVGAQELTFGGQIRPRTEFRNPVGDGHDVFTSMRTRLNITANLEQEVNVFIQLQDVRLWGEESDTFTDYNADNFDFHQAYMDIKNMGDSGHIPSHWTTGNRIGRAAHNRRSRMGTTRACIRWRSSQPSKPNGAQCKALVFAYPTPQPKI